MAEASQTEEAVSSSFCRMHRLEDDIASVAANGFSGVVRVDHGDEIELAGAYGFADRAHEISNTLDTQFATASGTKGLTALAVVGLIEDGVPRPVDDGAIGARRRPRPHPRTTSRRAPARNRSLIGDYLDEETELRRRRLRPCPSLCRGSLRRSSS